LEVGGIKRKKKNENKIKGGAVMKRNFKMDMSE
jgi:hypothetical protein